MNITEWLRRDLDQLEKAYRAIASLREEHPNASPEWLAILAEGWIDHSNQVRREIEERVGIPALQAQLWMSPAGRGIGEGEGPTSVITALLDALRKGVQAVAEFLSAGRLARRPTATLKEACDWRVVALLPGSLRIGLCLPDSIEQPEHWEGNMPAVREATSVFLEVVAWAASDDEEDVLLSQHPDIEKRRTLLNAVKPFLPRPRGTVDRLSLSGQLMPEGRDLTVTRKAAQRIDRALDRMILEEVESHSGSLRELDLDNFTMIIRDVEDLPEIRCGFDETLLEAAKEALGRQVKVTGVRQVVQGRRLASKKLKVFRLELLEDESNS